MRPQIQIKGKLKLYMQWPAFMSLLLIAMDIWIYRTDKKAGLMLAAFIVVYIIIAIFLYLYNKSYIFSDLVEFAAQYGVVQNTLLRELTIPYAILLDDGKIVWANNQFMTVLGKEYRQDTYLSKYISELNRSIFPQEDGQSVELQVEYDEHIFQVEMTRVSVQGFNDAEQLLALPAEKEYFIAIYLRDVTELNEYVRKHEEQKLMAGLVYIDNYDEVMESVEEVRQALLVALIDRKINQYFRNADGIVKKLEKDKYFVALRKRYFKELEEDKFSLLEEVKDINIGNGMPATLSIGLGLHGESYAQTSNYARSAIDLALARGGDQAVVKEQEGITYYGGKREQTAKNTRVKARVKAEAMREIMMTKDKVFIMGHQLGDVDSFGAAIGIYRVAQAMDKKAYIIINEITTSIRQFYDTFSEDSAYPKDLFISSRDVDNLVDDNMMVVVVDTNKPEMTECDRLLNMTKTIVVLDHHRQSSTPIENTVLSYIEPYASSTCEMVAEVVQYIEEDIKLSRIEASCMYAGIMIDTNNFTVRTGVRTFEAAAYLRRNGADLTYVRKLFRDDMEAYKAKAEIIGHVEMYREEFAIASSEELDIDSPTIIGAQVANELLNIEGVRASFVLTVYKDRIYVSARSIDEINVQIIMEQLGGGGHMNSAGTQFDYSDLSRAVRTLKETIDEMLIKGDI
ncbi:MAG: DHH family phosphoesterase [Lachnospiraceae bacterium]